MTPLLRAALATSEPTLDQAWAQAEAALPEGWVFGIIDHGPPSAYNPPPDQPFGQERCDAWAKLGISSSPAKVRARASTPTAALLALLALAARLQEAKP